MHKRPLFLRETHDILAVASRAEAAKLLTTRQEVTRWVGQHRSFQVPQNTETETAPPPSEIFRQMETDCPSEITSHARGIIMMVFLSFLAQSACSTYALETRGAENLKQISQPAEIQYTPKLLSLSEHPSSNKIAILVNGDTNELKSGKKHKKNIELAIEVLKEKGFQYFYVVSNQKLDNTNIKLHQFNGTTEGLDKMFEELKTKGVLKKDTLVFFYTTGHGKDIDRGCLVLENGCYSQSRLVDQLKIIKISRSGLLFVADQCYSGDIPNQIIESGIRGIAMSPGAEGQQSKCAGFTPKLFQLIRENFDSNGDGISTPVEWFQGAMANYKVYTGSKEPGKYRESRQELTRENFDAITQTNKMLIIFVNATWCGHCKNHKKTLDEIKGTLGDQVEIINLTVDVDPEGKQKDTNPQASEILKKFDVTPTGYPTTLIRQKDGKFIIITGKKSTVAFLDELKKINPDLIDRPWDREIIKRVAEREYSDALEALRDADKYINQPWARGIIERAAEKEPGEALRNADKYINQPWARGIIERAAEKEPAYAIRFASRYADQPWARGIIERAAEKAPFYALAYTEEYINQPWARGIIERAAEKEPGEALRNADKYINQPWARGIIERAARKEPSEALCWAYNFKDQPWSATLIKQAKKAVKKR